MTASPETIAEKLASIIDEKGPSALTDDPYGVYQKILSEKTADRRTVDMHPFNGLQLFHAVAGELLFVGLDGIQAYTIQEIDGGG